MSSNSDEGRLPPGGKFHSDIAHLLPRRSSARSGPRLRASTRRCVQGLGRGCAQADRSGGHDNDRLSPHPPGDAPQGAARDGAHPPPPLGTPPKRLLDRRAASGATPALPPRPLRTAGEQRKTTIYPSIRPSRSSGAKTYANASSLLAFPVNTRNFGRQPFHESSGLQASLTYFLFSRVDKTMFLEMAR
jgi:hypothetical protein